VLVDRREFLAAAAVSAAWPLPHLNALSQSAPRQYIELRRYHLLPVTKRYQIFRLQNDPNYVMIDLDFDSTREAEAFAKKMQRIWDGPAKGIMVNPRARIADIAEGKDV
jgi:hypothetical protein